LNIDKLQNIQKTWLKKDMKLQTSIFKLLIIYKGVGKKEVENFEKAAA
jgi:hypothetical protein